MFAKIPPIAAAVGGFDVGTFEEELSRIHERASGAFDENQSHFAAALFESTKSTMQFEIKTKRNWDDKSK